MISSGAISEMPGRLPAMKMIDPYSPTARANASAKPVRIAGQTTAREYVVDAFSNKLAAFQQNAAAA